MIRLVPYAVLIMVLSVSTLSQAQHCDPRDYEATYFAPNNMLQIQGYARHVSVSSEVNPANKRELSQSLGLLRASYVFKTGNLVIAPNLILPVAEVTSYGDGRVTGAAATPKADGTPGEVKTYANTVTHTSGIGDLRFFPTIAYNIVEDPMTATHTTIALSAWVYFATGSYDGAKMLNVGENRMTIAPELILGQRLFKVLTIEAYAAPVIRLDNKDFSGLIPSPNPAYGGAKVPTSKVTLSQELSLMAGAIVGVDLSKVAQVALTYSLDSVGKRLVEAPLQGIGLQQYEASQTIHSLRVTLGANLGETTHLLLQLSEEFAGSAEAHLGRYIGLRFTQRVVF